jgi:acetaldehyde dehydrogenase (acetylating)
VSLQDPDLLALQQVRDLVAQAVEAQQRWATFSQGQIDAVIDAMADAGAKDAERLARMAVEETGYGNVPDKIKKNLFACEELYRAIRPMKTVGILREDREQGIVEIAEPVGVVGAILPSTNPTSTALYKVLISLKARNAVVLSPHPSAKGCICATADVLTKAALKAGAPEGLIGCITQVSSKATSELMRHRRVGVILSTGGTGIVRAAYSSGKPAYGVGPGNVPAYIERTANVRKAVADIIAGKTFDNGVLCSAEQSIVVDEPLRKAVLQELREQGAYFLNVAQAEALGKLVIRPDTFLVNPKIVGRSAPVIAEMAGFQVPSTTRVLVAELTGVGRDFPLSAEKLSPILAFYTVKNWQEGVEHCNRLLRFGGLGHTISIHSQNEAAIRDFGLRVHAYRVVVNSPSTLGAVGYTTGLFPSMTLGCGTAGGNITADNISPRHLMNTKRIAYELRPYQAAAPGPAATRAPQAVKQPLPPPPPTPVPAVSTPSAGGAPNRGMIARVVERFLAQKEVPRGAGTTAAPAPTPSAVASAPPPEAVKPKPVDFVSESDVATAVERSEKILVSPGTIITPSARDLGDAHGIFVETAP